MLAQMGNGVVSQPGRWAAESDQPEDARRAYDAANLLGIAEAGKKITREKRFGDRLHSAGAGFAPDPDARGKGFDLSAACKIERSHVFTAALGTKAKPAKAAGIQQGTENFHAVTHDGRVVQ
jgi:hypothetical protein